MVRKTLHKIIDAFGILSAFFVAAIFVFMIVTSVMRTLGFKTSGSDDITSWMTAGAAFFGLAHTFRHGDFVRMGLLIERLGPSARRWQEVLALLLASVFTAYLTYSVGAYVFDTYRFGDVFDGLVPIKKWPIQLSIVIGCGLLCAAYIDEFIQVLRGERPGYVTAVEERHARGDFSEDV